MTMESRQRDSWKEKAQPQWQKRFVRDIRRLAVVLILLLLGGVLLYFLFPPFFAPTTHLVLLG
ncbi:MAG: hypothetical protein KDA45_13110, partial [Planctomycetales bacterium]|nr:hypothetical protein [Planctomycetales bacterium]